MQGRFSLGVAHRGDEKSLPDLEFFRRLADDPSKRERTSMTLAGRVIPRSATSVAGA